MTITPAACRPGYALEQIDPPEALGAPLELEVALDGVTHVLALEPVSMRADGFTLRVQRPDGSWEVRTPARPATWRGAIEGMPGSVAAMSLVDGQWHGVVGRAPGETVFGVQPLDEALPDAPADVYVVYDSADALPHGGTCAIAGLAPGGAAPTVGAGTYAGSGVAIAEIGIDSDVQFFNLNGGSVANTQADIEAVMNANDAIYESDVGINHAITTILVRTSEPDPYSSSDAFGLLDEFLTEWTTVQAGVPRDVAQLFTGRDIDGGIIGIAYVDVICNFDFQYGVVQSRFTNTFADRVALTAHELGHNWSSPHCDPDPDCAIMCPFLGGCTGIVDEFGSTATAAILAGKNAATCLDGGCDGALTFGETGITTTLTGSGTAAVGTDLTLTYADPSSAPSSAFGLVALASGSFPLGPGVLLLDPQTIVLQLPDVFFATIGSTPTQALPIPNNGALVGLQFFVQAIHFTGAFGGVPSITEYSNGLDVTICP